MRELYCIRFNKVTTATDMFSTTYVLGAPPPNSTSIVKKRELKEDRVITTFADKTQHIIGYTPEVELFYRDKPKKDAKETGD